MGGGSLVFIALPVGEVGDGDSVSQRSLNEWAWLLLPYLTLLLLSTVCLAVWRNHHMRTVTNYFIVNLSLADVLVTAICLPASLLVDITESWLFGHALCKVIPYLQVSSPTPLRGL